MPAPAGSCPGSVRHIVIGRISGLFGTAGWIKVQSFTRPPDNILTYDPWLLGAAPDWREFRLAGSHYVGRSLRAHLRGIEDPDQARGLVGSNIAVCRSQLPALPDGQHYWCDLVGLRVENQDRVYLGTVTDLWAAGGHDLLVVEGAMRILIPYVPGRFVKTVDLARRCIEVDWIIGYL